MPPEYSSKSIIGKTSTVKSEIQGNKALRIAGIVGGKVALHKDIRVKVSRAVNPKLICASLP